MYFLNCRTSRSEFIISVNRYLEAKKHKLSVGMRFKMRFEGDEAPERRYCLYLANHCKLINGGKSLIINQGLFTSY